MSSAQLDSHSEKEQYFKLANQAFIVALNDENKSTSVVVQSMADQRIDEFVSRARQLLEQEDLLFKVIGPLKMINGITKLLEVHSKRIKSVQRNGEYEVFYFPSTGRIRVTKSKEVDVENDLQEKVKVLIVDDSKTMRSILKKMLIQDDKIEVCAMASKPSEVESLIKEHKPDVITLDIHMPEMTGVELFVNTIGPKYKIPTIMITSLSMEDGPLVVEALENGAFDYIQKPDAKKIPEVAPILIEKVKQAALSQMSFSPTGEVQQIAATYNQDAIVVIGSSTGGTHTLKDILVKMPKHIPPILIVQHIPPVFSKAFADRMNGMCPFEVKEAEDGDAIIPNRVLVAPGGKHMKAIRMGTDYKVVITDDPPVNRFKPSVDYMFQSVVPLCRKKHIVGIILTGMGKDGARQLLELRNAGALTIAQSEKTSTVFGMPREAIEIGAATTIEDTEDIAEKIAEFSWKNESKQNKAS